MICDKCGSTLKHRDYVKRIMKSENGVAEWIYIERLICCDCKSIHRQLPEDLLPYKHYRTDIIEGVLIGTVSCEDFTYEDFPSEMTMMRWKKSQWLQLLFYK